MRYTCTVCTLVIALPFWSCGVCADTSTKNIPMYIWTWWRNDSDSKTEQEWERFPYALLEPRASPCSCHSVGAWWCLVGCGSTLHIRRLTSPFPFTSAPTPVLGPNLYVLPLLRQAPICSYLHVFTHTHSFVCDVQLCSQVCTGTKAGIKKMSQENHCYCYC